MPVTVAQTDSWFPLSAGFQVKVFYANARFWVFFIDGNNLVYCTSLDGTIWTNKIIIRSGVTDASRFSIYYDGTYLHYALVSGAWDGPMYYRRGYPNTDGTIT